MSALGEKAYDRECRQRAIEHIRAHPLRFSTDSLARFSGFWIGEWWAGYRHIAWFYSLGSIALSVLALRGAIRARRVGIGLFAASVLMFGAPYYVTVHGHGRYRAPIEPLMCLMAVLGPAREPSSRPMASRDEA